MIYKHDYTALTVSEDKLYRYSDGDGREVKRIAEKCQIYLPEQTECWWSGGDSIYYIRSSVLGGEPVSEVGSGGGKSVSYVRVGKSILAHLIRNYVWQQGGGYSFNAVYYEHTDSSGMSYRMTERQMPFGYGDYSDARQAEFDAGGTNVGLVTNYNPPPGDPPENFAPLEDTSPLWINGQRVTATLDGMAISWQIIRHLAVSGGLAVDLRNFRGQVIDQSPVHYTNGSLYFVNSLTYRQPVEGPVQILSYNLTSIDISWTPQTQQQTKDDIGLRDTKKKAVFSEERFKDCLEDLFQITPKRRNEIIDYEQDTSLGLIFRSVSGGWTGNFVGNRMDNGRQVGVIIDGVSQTKQQQGGALGHRPRNYGATVKIGSDIKNFIAAMATAIHEVGNGLVPVMPKGLDYAGPPKARDPLLAIFDDDSGIALEECVFGSYVGENGNVFKAYLKKPRKKK